ncbi:cytochrome P450 [Umbelopsis sp. PMI_123]|nr:cytochrome P450 [Umbelopsis sp. PMI_123]
MKVISIGVATTITAYTLYSAFSAKNPFADLPKSSFNAIRSFTYDPKQKDKEREEEYPVFEKKDFIGKQALVVNDVDIAHQALAQQDRYRKGHLYGRSPLFSYVHRLLFGGANIANASGEDWKIRREVLVPLFQGRVMLPELLPFIIRRAQLLVEEIRSHQGRPIDIDQCYVTLTSDVICEYLFGQTPSPGEIKFDNFVNPAKAIAGIKLKSLYAMFGLKESASAEIERNCEYIRKLIDKVKRGEKLRENGRPTLAEKLIQLEQYQGPEGEERLILELLIMIFAGHDTTAHSMTMLTYTLAQEQECQQKIREEANKIIPDEDSLTAYNLGKLQYTSAAIKESLRLHPVVPELSVQCHKDNFLGHIHIPAGSTVLLPVLRLQRDPAFFKKPLAFKPERWLEEDLELQADLETVGSGKSQLTKAFLTFSQGTHSCLGMNLAYLELRVVTALLVQNFEIRYHGPVPEIVNALLRLKESPLMEFHPLK